MKILIKVTKDILKKSAMCGEDGEFISKNCAIALAIRDLFPLASIGHPSITFFEGYRYTDLLPNEALDFISSFDCLDPHQRVLMPELSFEIEVPSEVIDKIGIGQAYKILSESRTLELVHP